MATDNRRSKERMKYGICLNDECSMCKSKTIQQIPMRKEFVCSECGKELRECRPPKKGGKLPLYIGLAGLAAVALVAGGIAIFSGRGDEPQAEGTDTIPAVDTTKVAAEVKPDTVVTRDTVVVRDTIVQNNTITTSEKEITKTVVSTTSSAQPKAPKTGSGTLRLSYGTYTGATKGGYPHGQGRLTYSTTRQINRNDVKGRTANAGDYVIGEFHNGFVVYGKHYDSEGNLLESLNIGVGSEDSYESK